MKKLYVITRGDLPPGARACQLFHAGRAFAAEHPDVEREWFETSNTVAFLEVPTEKDLEALERRARVAGTPVSIFREPDFGDALTALALGPTGAKHVRSLPKALR